MIDDDDDDGDYIYLSIYSIDFYRLLGAVVYYYQRSIVILGYLASKGKQTL